MNVDHRLLPVFLAVAEERHFGRAAGRLHTTQPAVSQQIRRLESQLGGPLFIRTTRSVELTPAGRQLLTDLAPGLDQINAALRTARAALAGDLTRLRLGFLSSMAGRLVPHVVTALRAAHPHTVLELHELDFDAQLDRLRDAHLDLGLVHQTAGMERVPELLATPLGDMSLYVALPAGHRLVDRERLDLSELRDEIWVLPGAPPAHTYRANFYRLCRRYGFTPRSTTAGANMQSMLGLVAAGAGISWAPATARTASGQLAFVRVDGESVTLHLLHHRHPVTGVRKIVTALTAAVSDHLRNEHTRP